MYYFLNNYQQSTCLALQQKKGKAYGVVRFNCDDDRLEMQWIKKDSFNPNFQGAFYICQSSNDEMTCLSDDSQNLNSVGNSFVPLSMNSYADGRRVTSKFRYQNWKLNPKTNQIVNLETRLCLTSLDSKPLSNTSTVRLLSAGVRSCTKGANVNIQQKWYLEPVPKC